MEASLSLQTVNNQFLERELKNLHTAALTSSLRARQRRLETTPEDGMVRSALKVCKELSVKIIQPALAVFDVFGCL